MTESAERETAWQRDICISQGQCQVHKEQRKLDHLKSESKGAAIEVLTCAAQQTNSFWHRVGQVNSVCQIRVARRE